MMTKLLQGLNDRKLNNNPNRVKLIASIISKRMYVINDEFAKEYVSGPVMMVLLEEFCTRVGTNSVHTIMNDETVKAFSDFYNKMNELLPGLKLTSKKYIKKIDTAIGAILLLSQEKSWKIWFMYNRQYMTKTVHSIYLLVHFYILGKSVPRYILDYFVMNDKKLNVIEQFFNTEHEELSDKMIKDIESLGYPRKYAHYLFRYWSNGGTYFPENADSIKPYLSEGWKSLETFMNNISGENPSLGFETYFALKNMMDGLEPEGDDDVGYSFTMAVTEAIDRLFGLAQKDINILWAIPRTNIPNGVYQGILRDDDYRQRFLTLMDTSEIPLKDATLYTSLFGDIKKLTKHQLMFIRRGGTLKTLILEGYIDNRMYNACYTRDGLCEMLTFSSDSNIIDLMESDDLFLEFVLSEMSRCSLNYLNDAKLRKLFKCIMNSDHRVYKSMYMVANYIFKLIGEDRLISEIPSSMKLFLDNRMSRLLYPDSTKYINSETLPYVPIRLLSGVIVDKCLSSNVLDGTRPPVLNTEYSYLDWVMTTTQLNDQFINKQNIGYIADLSLEAAEGYIQFLSEP